MPALIWDSGALGSNLTLSAGDSTVTHASGSGAWTSVRATTALTGKFYLEITMPACVNFWTGGVSGGTPSLADYLAATSGVAVPIGNSFGNTQLVRNGAGIGTAIGITAVPGQILRIAGDEPNDKLWFAIDTTTPNGASIWQDGSLSAADPATNTGGVDMSAVSGTWRAAFSSFNTTNSAVINGGATPFTYAPPAGFDPVDPPGTVTLDLAATVTPTIAATIGAPDTIAIDATVTPSLAATLAGLDTIDLAVTVTPALAATLSAPAGLNLAVTVTPALAATIAVTDRLDVSATVTPSVFIVLGKQALITIDVTVTPTTGATITPRFAFALNDVDFQDGPWQPEQTGAFTPPTSVLLSQSAVAV